MMGKILKMHPVRSNCSKYAKSQQILQDLDQARQETFRTMDRAQDVLSFLIQQNANAFTRLPRIALLLAHLPQRSCLCQVFGEGNHGISEGTLILSMSFSEMELAPKLLFCPEFFPSPIYSSLYFCPYLLLGIIKMSVVKLIY